MIYICIYTYIYVKESMGIYKLWKKTPGNEIKEKDMVSILQH